MAFLLENYRAKCVQEKVKFIHKESKDLKSKHTGDIGLLLIYESENKYPGKPFVVFYTEKSILQTSPGDMEIDYENMTISINTINSNYYKFKILNQVIIKPS